MLFRNNKTKALYNVISTAVDCTNSRDGLDVIIYQEVYNPLVVYVREMKEFYEKFTEEK